MFETLTPLFWISPYLLIAAALLAMPTEIVPNKD